MDDSRSDIRAEPRTDPAADALLKRRVEKQAANVVGDRAKGVEVHVVGRSITIQARGVKLFQRRAVRRDLERLPVISGYRSVVELDASPRPDRYRRVRHAERLRATPPAG